MLLYLDRTTNQRLILSPLNGSLVCKLFAHYIQYNMFNLWRMKTLKKLKLMWAAVLIVICCTLSYITIFSKIRTIFMMNYLRQNNVHTCDYIESEEEIFTDILESNNSEKNRYNYTMPLTSDETCRDMFLLNSKFSSFLDVNQLAPLGVSSLKSKTSSFNFNEVKDSHEVKTLKVYIVPHSHNDPGWLQSFEEYYKQRTYHILKNVVKYLSEDSKKKFIWAEISFLYLFWKEINLDMKKKFKKLLENRQLEIVNGGWVMNDEANTHYFAILQQMIEGHLWLDNHLNYAPKNSWAIDPFGHSSTMPYILKQMGFQNLVIQRVHNTIKQFLALSKNLEFYWRQSWDNSVSTDLFTHLMPFGGYNIAHTCGPNFGICRQFDYYSKKKMYSYINEKNIMSKANILLDQFRKKAQIFRTNLLLVPLGGDFRYATEKELEVQFGNYQKLMDYMNSNKRMNVDVKFGTLEDYFEALHSTYSSENFTIVLGDFFTYSDSHNNYWSGYFTSRPFYKRMDRILNSDLRSAELLYSLVLGSKKMSTDWLYSPASSLYKCLTEARRSISLFQHHDAITGTAKSNVMKDYLGKLINASLQLQHIMQQTVYLLLSNNFYAPFLMQPESVFFIKAGSQNMFSDDFTEKITLAQDAGQPKKIIIFNPLTWKRQEIVSVHVDVHNIQVTNSDGHLVRSQTSPVFSSFGGMINNIYIVSFEVKIDPLSLTTYFIRRLTCAEENEINVLSNIQLFNFIGPLHVSSGFENVAKTGEIAEFFISNDIMKADFSKYGFLSAISFCNSNITIQVRIDFVLYNSRKGGAYVFSPDGPAHSLFIDHSSLVRVSDGPLYSQVDVELDVVKHSVKMYKRTELGAIGLEIKNFVNIIGLHNSELAMRITSQIKNRDEFFTDLNGLQIIKRKYSSKLPIAGNYYPMSTAAYIEDENNRLTIVSGQPGGFSSLKEGEMEIMQDRRLAQDDHNGLGEGILDNVPINPVYTILLERKKKHCSYIHKNHSSGILSQFSYLISNSILYPLTIFLHEKEPDNALKLNFSPMEQELEHDLHIVKLHPHFKGKKSRVGIIFHRTPINPCFPVGNKIVYRSGTINMASLFPQHFGNTVEQTTLTFLHAVKTYTKNYTQKICPMSLKAYLLSP